MATWAIVPKFSTPIVEGAEGSKAFVTSTIRLIASLTGEATDLTDVVARVQFGDMSVAEYDAGQFTSGIYEGSYFVDVTIPVAGILRAYFEAQYTDNRQVESNRVVLTVLYEF